MDGAAQDEHGAASRRTSRTRFEVRAAAWECSAYQEAVDVGKEGGGKG